MASIAPINYIEIRDEDGYETAHVAGTRITVGEIAHMHLYGDSPVDWIVENFDALDHAQVHAALSYYYDHKDEIDTQMRRDEEFIRSQADATLAELIQKRRAE